MTGSEDAVRAQADAVDQVAQAVRSYLDQEQALLAQARGKLTAAAEHAAAEVRSRQGVLAEACARVADLERALAQCRENCGGISRALGAARRRQADAEESLARAQQALRHVQEAQAGLHAAARSHEPTVIEHGRAAIESCRQLATKLRGYLSGSHLLTAAEIAVTIVGAGHSTLTRPFVSEPSEPTSLVQSEEDQQSEQVQLWRDYKTKDLEERSGDWINRRD